ncbi:hypothetical protein HY251_07050 [bacterium]|nr:hypothetical protein [bacterium]
MRSAGGLGVLLSFLLAFTSTSRASAPNREPLWQAKKLGHITVKGVSTSGHSAARLVISNKTGEDISVDVNGSYLQPRGSRVQPLGIGLMHAGSSDTEISVRSGSSASTGVLTVCMDQSVSSPNSCTAFELAEEEAPGQTGQILKMWKDQPTIDQQSIQTAVWSGHANDAWTEGLPGNTKKVGVLQGEVLVLREGGELLRGSAADGLTQIASGIVDFFLDRSGLHALRRTRADDGQRAHDRGFCIARYDLGHGGRWSEEQAVYPAERVLWASSEGALVADANHLYLFAGPFDWRVLGSPRDQVTPTDEGALIMGESKNGETALTRIVREDDQLRVDELSASAKLSTIAQAPDAIYALSDKGSLLRLSRQGERLATKSPAVDCRSIVSARTFVAIRTGKGVVLEGSYRDPISIPAPPDGGELLADRGRGELYAFATPALHRWDSKRSSWEKVHLRRKPDGSSHPASVSSPAATTPGSVTAPAPAPAEAAPAAGPDSDAGSPLRVKIRLRDPAAVSPPAAPAAKADSGAGSEPDSPFRFWVRIRFRDPASRE